MKIKLIALLCVAAHLYAGNNAMMTGSEIPVMGALDNPGVGTTRLRAESGIRSLARSYIRVRRASKKQPIPGKTNPFEDASLEKQLTICESGTL
jgi:hypothetical protein